MELTPEQENAIARLYENESLTENLTDRDAQALLEWAQGQIVANTDDALVRAAVSAANSSGEQGVQALVTQASTFLAKELEVREAAASRSNDSPSALKLGDSIAPLSESISKELTGQPETGHPARLEDSPTVAQSNALSATAGGNLGPATPTSAPKPAVKPKKSRKPKRRKKK
jgi:hypothetical protein